MPDVTTEKYPVDERVFGRENQEVATVVTIPRSHFVQVVQDTIKNDLFSVAGYEAEVLDTAIKVIREAATSIDRFGVDTWIHETRGCGCLIGETLIAAGVDMADFTISTTRPGKKIYNVSEALQNLYGHDVAAVLEHFGLAVNRRMNNLLADNLEISESEITDEWVVVFDEK